MTVYQEYNQNLQNVFDTVLLNEEISRWGISRALNIPLTTSLDRTRKLVKQKLLKSRLEDERRTVGRKRRLYSVNEKFWDSFLLISRIICGKLTTTNGNR